MSVKSALARWRVLILLVLCALALSACDTIIPTADAFATADGLQAYTCTASAGIRNIFLILGLFFALIGLGGYALKQLAPSFFGQQLSAVEGSVSKIVFGGLLLGIGPGALIQFFIAMGAVGC